MSCYRLDTDEVLNSNHKHLKHKFGLISFNQKGELKMINVGAIIVKMYIAIQSTNKL